jgi:hypothetical protein
LYFKPDVALEIVNDLIDEPSTKVAVGAEGQSSNLIDKETKSLASRIKKSTSFKFYKQHYSQFK